MVTASAGPGFESGPVNLGRVVCRRAAPLANGYERALYAWRHGRVDDAKNAFGARPNPARPFVPELT